MGSEDFEYEMNKEEIFKLINQERDVNGLYSKSIKLISNIIVEESPLYERIQKIQGAIMTLKFELGEKSN